MNDDTETVAIDEEVTVQSLAGKRFTLTIQQLDRSPAGDRIEARFICDYDTWNDLSAAGAFHLDDVAERPDLHPDGRVELHCRLRPTLFETVPDRLDDLSDDLHDSHLAHTEAWYVTAVVSAIDKPDGNEDGAGDISGSTARMGIQTVWSEVFAESTDASALEAITGHFDAEGWDYDEPEPGMVEIEITIRGSSLPVYCYTDGDDRECQLYAVHPGRVPESNWDELTAMIATRNYELERGAFGLNEVDGSVRYRRRADLDRDAIEVAFDDTVAAMASVYEDIWYWAEDPDG